MGKSIPCVHCNLTFYTLDRLRSHLEKNGFDHPCILLPLGNWAEVTEWRQKYETEHIINFCQRNTKKLDKGKATYYLCSRNNCFIRPSTAKGLRTAKKLLREGPSKIQEHCTAGFTVIEKDGSFKVKLYPTHLNHSIDIRHKASLKTPKDKNQQYIKQMKMGATIPGILRNVHEDLDENYHIYKDNPAVEHNINYDKLYYLKKKMYMIKHVKIPAITRVF